jgi:hypothetical protein
MVYIFPFFMKGHSQNPPFSYLRIRSWIFSLYRKFLKSSEIVYNGLEIKNDITKERRGLRHDVVYEVFCFGLG